MHIHVYHMHTPMCGYMLTFSEGVAVEANVGDSELKRGLAALRTAVDLMCSSKYLEAVRLLKPK